MKKEQYIQGIGKYKALSTSAGIGSIIPTKWGGFIMPRSLSKWAAIEQLKTAVVNNKTDTHPLTTQQLIDQIDYCDLVTDDRFIDYLKENKQLPNLEFLVSVPHLQINESGACDVSSHPLCKKWLQRNPGREATDFPHSECLKIPGVVFPRWFKSIKAGNVLMKIEEWKDKWNKETRDPARFVQPVEAKKDTDGNVLRVKVQVGNNTYNNVVGIPLEQVQMVLICPNGHISDIPWDRFFALKLDAIQNNKHLTGDDYRDLFGFSPYCQNGITPRLQWIVNRDNPESYGTLKCQNKEQCPHNNICPGKVSLEGIMNIRPMCPGYKPWVGDPNTNRSAKEHCDETMRWALVTSNSVYYADSFKSLYIPTDLLTPEVTVDGDARNAYNSLMSLYESWTEKDDLSKDFFKDYLFLEALEVLLYEYNDEQEPEDCINIQDILPYVEKMVDVLIGTLPVDTLSDKNAKKVCRRILRKYSSCNHQQVFIVFTIIYGLDNYATINSDEAIEVYNYYNKPRTEAMTEEKYRYDEFCAIESADIYDVGDKPLSFSKVDLNVFKNNKLASCFSHIKQIHRLAISTTQLGFSRAEMPQPLQSGNTIVWPQKQTIYDCKNDEVIALPANQNFGEGLFFSFNEDVINEFCSQENILKRYANVDPGDMGKSLKMQMDLYSQKLGKENGYCSAKFYMLHTFSHLIMKELEFSCGYPTASLQERLYFSDRMCGVLIYTADGSEGSMGGLVSQGQPEIIEDIIIKALDRALDCSSDPLCWQHSDQLNFAACFSCCMVSETSCEQWNLGLDRRALVDEEFGFFKNLI